MRVIAGSAKHIPLKSIDGLSTRPTTDKIKETLFNIINFRLDECIFLDLFAGSGAIGIEALSRGAKRAYFVEKNRKAAECIKENIKKTKLEDGAKILIGDVLSKLKTLAADEELFDIVFLDPPYDKNLEIPVLEFLKTSKIINKDSLIIMEMSLKADLNFISEDLWELTKIKEYKTNKHIFIKRRY